jgi:Fe2+ transport system protein FeoA
MLLRALAVLAARVRRRARPVARVGAPCVAGCRVPCEHPWQPCALVSLPAGVRARVTCVGCPHVDAERLRVLGVFEGAPVRVVAHRSGVLLEVRGARLALDGVLAATIVAQPLAAWP